jgi:tetratricopeptide (TPR) repeat protein
MHRVFDALADLLPLSLDSARFKAPENQAEIARAIGMLAGAVLAVEHHGERRDPGFRFLSRSLAADIEEIRQRYHWGRLDEARFFVLEATRNCVACHSRLPSAREFPLADKLLSRIDLEAVSHHERGQIYIATRQFDRALANWEELFASQELTPSQLHLGGYLRDYLTVALRVQGDLPRARKTLEKLSAQLDLPPYLALRIETWIRDLETLEAEPRNSRDLARARALVNRVPTTQQVPDDAALTISDLLASSMLLGYIDSAQQWGTSDASVAEAFYLLGVVEARGVDAYWVPQAEFHLEAAIRMDPQGPMAQRAFSLLEQSMAIGYGGTSPDVLPADLWTKLEELRKLARRESVEPGALP